MRMWLWHRHRWSRWRFFSIRGVEQAGVQRRECEICGKAKELLA